MSLGSSPVSHHSSYMYVCSTGTYIAKESFYYYNVRMLLLDSSLGCLPGTAQLGKLMVYRNLHSGEVKYITARKAEHNSPGPQALSGAESPRILYVYRSRRTTFYPHPFFADPANHYQFISTATVPKAKGHIKMIQGLTEWNPVDTLRNMPVSGLSIFISRVSFFPTDI